MIRKARLSRGALLAALAATFGVLCASALELAYAPTPFVWILASWSGFFFAGAVVLRRAAVRLVCVNVSGLFLLLFLLESILWFLPRFGGKPGEFATPRFRDTEGRVWESSHPVLGYAPVPGAVIEATKKDDRQVVYDATYTIGLNGLRISRPPDAPVPDTGEALLFFGCSMTFGEGLNDQETLPWQVADELGVEFRVFNFGYGGYGPHQMLAALESGLVDLILSGATPRVVVFQTMHNHVLRSAGYAFWDTSGPRYSLDGKGEVSYRGPFAAQPDLLERLIPVVRRSSIGWRFVRREWFPPASPRDVELYLGIIEKARVIAESRYPGARFCVVLWDWNDGPPWITRTIRDGLAARRIETHLASRILPGFSTDESPYRILLDGHANALANRKIARYIVEHVVRVPAAH